MLEATPHRCRPDSPFAAPCFHSVAEAHAPQRAARRWSRATDKVSTPGPGGVA
jgi:hypothetical protein